MRHTGAAHTGTNQDTGTVSPQGQASLGTGARRLGFTELRTASDQHIHDQAPQAQDARCPASALPTPPPPMWRFYERHHPHSLWHADFMDKITLTDTKEQVHQLTLQDDYSRGYVFCDLALDHDQRTVSVLKGASLSPRLWPNPRISSECIARIAQLMRNLYNRRMKTAFPRVFDLTNRVGRWPGLRLQEGIMTGMEYGFDPDELLSHEIVIDKIDAARRQLESAVKMFFYEWDVVSQHTLISAANGILYDLAKQQGIQGSIKDSPLIWSEERKEFIKAINLPQNFFKHADQDGGKKLVFRYRLSPFYLFAAVRLLVLLGGSVTYTVKVFLMWFQLRYPELLCFQPDEEDLRRIREDTTNPELFKALARQLLQGSGSSREA
jgi:hypothetical protein